MVFPLFKLGGLIIKSMLKPLATGLKIYAKKSPKFHDSSYWLANMYIRAQNGLFKKLNLPYQSKKLTSDEAVDLGVGLIGESFLLTGTGAVLYYEYYRARPASEESKIKFTKLDERLDDIENEVTLLKSHKLDKQYRNKLYN